MFSAQFLVFCRNDDPAGRGAWQPTFDLLYSLRPLPSNVSYSLPFVTVTYFGDSALHGAPVALVPKYTTTVFRFSTTTRMWADAQRDGRPAEYRWRPLLKFGNSVNCTASQSLADASCWSAVQ